MTFEQLNIITPILKAIAFEGYETPSPIQEQAIPILLEGKDILASAQTGTGKTAAFAVPIIQALYNQDRSKITRKQIQALILAPTRELAEQIKDSFRSYSRNLGIKTEVVYGGVSQRNQETALNKGVDVLIATPGRLLDLMGQHLVNLDHVKFFVLDEADRMLDMGFIYDVKRIVMSVPKTRQTMLFSATIPNEILKLANEMLDNPVRIEVTPPEAMIDKIKQSLFYVSKKDKNNLLIDLLVKPSLQSILIFTRTKHGANKLVKELLSYGVKADAIHGNKSQARRQAALLDFKLKKLRVLVATDIAARGIDIDELSHVINFDLPETPETYVHRMGRTGRAGLSGEVYSFCSQDENNLLISIEKHIKMSIPVVEEQPFHVTIRLTGTPSDQPIKKQSRGTLKNKKNPKKDSKTLKKSTLEKPKKSYHALLEEQDFKKDVFKRSEMKREKPLVLKDDEDEKPKFEKRSGDDFKKSYQPRGFDKGDSFKSNDRYQSENKRPYTPRTNADGSPRPYTPRTNPDGTPKPYTPRTNADGSPRPYTPRTNPDGTPKPYTPRPNQDGSPRPYTPRTNPDGTPKPYTPRPNQDGSPKPYTPRPNPDGTPRPYTPRTNPDGTPKPYTPRPTSGSPDQKKSYTPRSGSDQNRPFSPSKKPNNFSK
jgi:ATP-dependent RNA helicase RhlE